MRHATRLVVTPLLSNLIHIIFFVCPTRLQQKRHVWKSKSERTCGMGPHTRLAHRTCSYVAYALGQ